MSRASTMPIFAVHCPCRQRAKCLRCDKTPQSCAEGRDCGRRRESTAPGLQTVEGIGAAGGGGGGRIVEQNQKKGSLTALETGAPRCTAHVQTDVRSAMSPGMTGRSRISRLPCTPCIPCTPCGPARTSSALYALSEHRLYTMYLPSWYLSHSSSDTGASSIAVLASPQWGAVPHASHSKGQTCVCCPTTLTHSGTASPPARDCGKCPQRLRTGSPWR
jgi:hypothetical protein